jgi:nucleoid-associated protein YgaU
MLLYRIAKADYIHDISGKGGLYGPARWHRQGTRILYTSMSEPLARLEILANYNIMPPNMKLLTLEIEDGKLSFDQVKLEDLPPDWARTGPYPPELAEMAREWLDLNKTLGLMVASVHSQVDRNMLINPLHPSHAHLRIASVTDVAFDPRLRGGITQYTVQQGDRIAQVAKRFYGDPTKWRLIFEANRDQLGNSRRLTPGTTLKIPSLH